MVKFWTDKHKHEKEDLQQVVIHSRRECCPHALQKEHLYEQFEIDGQLNGNMYFVMYNNRTSPHRTNYKLLDNIIYKLAGKLKIEQQQNLRA